MNELMCEMCGSNMVKKEGGFYVCQACGTKFPVNTSTNDNQQSSTNESNSRLDNLYELAERARVNGDSESAFNYYSEILMNDPYDWEAQFYMGYYRTYLYEYLDANGLNELYSSISSAVSIVDEIDDVEERNDAIGIFTDDTIKLVEDFYKPYFDQMEDEYPDGEDYEWYANTILELSYFLNDYGDLIENITDNTYNDSLDAWIYAIDIHTSMYEFISFFDKGEHDKYMDERVAIIHEYNPDYEKPKTKKLFGIF